MQIFNVRFGLATNSSSSHSMIFLKEGVVAEDYSGYRISFTTDTIEERYAGEFGWERFTAASPARKMVYLGIMLRETIKDKLTPEISELVIKGWLDGLEIGDENYIDHQSLMYLPSAFGTELPDKQFFDALKAYFLHDRLVILGGNDNESTEHALDDGTSFNLALPSDCGRASKHVCRYDEKYDFWTIFEGQSGAKMRFRLQPGSNDFESIPDKASTPELVDINITDYCPFGCAFCYMSSTTKGKHACLSNIYGLSHNLAKLKVFEVALGGGEPTMHPSFAEVLKQFREVGIVPNFTTKNLNWLRNAKQWPTIMKYAGNFAYTAENIEEIREFVNLLDYNGILRNRANIHIVMGTVDAYWFRSMLTVCAELHVRVTLLGYKRYGFGTDFTPKPYDYWLREIMDLHEQKTYCEVSIDTVLAAEYEQQILEAGIPEYLFHTEDGKFSCYIDAVKGKIGPSSFCGEDKLIDLDCSRYGNEEAIKAAFASF